MRVALYGATGFLGGLVRDELERLGVPTVLVGRRTEHVRALADRAGICAVRTAPIDDPAALRQAVADCDVLLNCAPTGSCAIPLVETALAVGAHYVDAAGDQPFIRHLFEEWSAPAATRGIVIAPAMGFDYALGDCLAILTATGHTPARDVTVAYVITGSGVSAASAQHAATTAGGSEVVYRHGRWQPVPFEIDRASFRFPDPIGPRQMARYGAGEVITLPRQIETDAVHALITVTSLAPARLASVFPYLRPLVTWIRGTPLRVLLTIAGRLSAGGSAPAPSPPSLASRQEETFMIGALVHGRDDSVGHGVVAGRDFHGITAATLAYGAREVAGRDGLEGGTFGPAAVLDPTRFLEHLAERGVTVEVR